MTTLSHLSSASQSFAGCVTCGSSFSEQSWSEHHTGCVVAALTIEKFIQDIQTQDKSAKKMKTKLIRKEQTKNSSSTAAVWSKEQIALLVTLLRRYGSDFSMIATHMTKTRDQIKRKFKVLERTQSHLAQAIFERETPSTSQSFQVQMDDFLC